MNRTDDIGLVRPLPYFTQQTDSHCGPAVIQILLGYYYRNFTQDQIVTAANASLTIEEYGTSPQELAAAVRTLVPDLKLWFKQPTTWVDLHFLLHIYHLPVVVNWQGLFYDTEEEEIRKGGLEADRGHYCLVTNIDLWQRTITLFDPYPEFAVKPRVFDLNWFTKRWWDENEDEDMDTHQLIFILTSTQAQFPKMLGMNRTP
jgi:ABC-type bacteriocin/lantibiotic exporter with double-glycine peptidase domain